MLDKIAKFWQDFKIAIVAAALAVVYFIGRKRGKENEKASQNKKVLENLGRADKARASLRNPILLASCTTNTSGDYCLLYRPIYADYKSDTPETIRQIDDNNVVWDKLCN
jgi:hypothetical protein